jgi:sugar/nucleoside kinase (ribokinase family)
VSTHDVACVGPAGVDIILDGLEALPANGELAHAARSEVAPGGSCNVAIACSRLGLRSALVAPVCQDDLGSMLTARLAGAGVDWVGPPGIRTPVSVALATGGERAFVHSADPRPLLATDVGLLAPRAVIGDVEGIPPGPDAPRMYATCDTVQAHQCAGRPEHLIGAAGAVIMNAGEAALVTGQSDPEEAVVVLARLVGTAIVTLGADGAVAASGGIVAHAEAPRQAVRALVGAGDVFTAAYVWADLAGSPLAERLALACLYATLSLRAPSVLRGALTLRELVRAAESHGVPLPPATQGL